MSKNTRTRILLTAVAALLLVVMAVGGTLAYLQDTTAAVVNEFDPHGINIELTETKDADGEWHMDMIPGTVKSKNPTVTVDTDTTTVPIYVFVKVDETNVPEALVYTLNMENAGFDKLDETTYPGVWYRTWDPDIHAADYSWNLLVNNQVSVAADTAVAVTGGTINGGSLTFQAWAIQMVKTNVDGVETNWDPADAYKQAAGL